MTQKRNQVLLLPKQRTAVALLDVENRLGISANANILIEIGLEVIEAAKNGNNELQEIVKSKFEVINQK